MSLGNFIVKGNLVTSTGVTVDGDYNNLINKPTIPNTLTDLGISDGTAGQVLTTNGSGSFTFTTSFADRYVAAILFS